METFEQHGCLLGVFKKDTLIMKRTTLLVTAFLTMQVAFAQEIDSLQVEEPQIEVIEADGLALDSLSQIEMIDESIATSDTVYIREVVYDTVYMSTPSESVEIQAENVDIHSDFKPRKKPEIRTLAGSMGHSGGFGALTFKSSKFRDETVVMAGIRGGWIINRSLAIGLEGFGFIPTAKFQGLSQFDAVLIGGYGGMFLEPIFFSNQVVHVTFPVSAGAGWMGYHEDFDEGTFNDPDLIEGDVFWYVEPGANVEFNLARNFRLALGISKRFTQDLELIDTNSDDFNKISYYLTLKIGSF